MTKNFKLIVFIVVTLQFVGCKSVHSNTSGEKQLYSYNQLVDEAPKELDAEGKELYKAVAWVLKYSQPTLVSRP